MLMATLEFAGSMNAVGNCSVARGAGGSMDQERRGRGEPKEEQEAVMREDKSRRTGNEGVAISTGSRSRSREGGREG